MSRIAEVFNKLNGKKALISYITAGDPDLITTLKLMHALVENGADIIELGVPFSDPMADGVVIQKAIERALLNHVSLQDVLELVHLFRTENKSTPIVLMGYINPIEHFGYESFAKSAYEVGVDGVLTVDAPVEYMGDLKLKLDQYHIDVIFLIAPTTLEERIKKISKAASGFIYYVSLKGVTGSSALNTNEVQKKVSEIKRYVDLPIAVGFGIIDSESAKKISECADAVVVGSLLVNAIDKHKSAPVEVISQITKELKNAITV